MPEEGNIERRYVVPLRKEWLKVAHYRRAEKAMRALKSFLAKHMKVSPENVKVGKYLNESVWSRGAKNPPHKISVVVKKEGEKVLAELEGYEKLKEKEEKKKRKKQKGKAKEEQKQKEKKESKEEKSEKEEEKKEEKKEEISEKKEKVEEEKTKSEEKEQQTSSDETKSSS